MSFDDLQMMTQRCNYLAAALDEALQALESVCRYPEPEYGSASKGEVVLSKQEKWRKLRRLDEDVDKAIGVLTNEYQRAIRHRDAAKASTSYQKAFFKIEDL